jgi:hypothetical protein
MRPLPVGSQQRARGFDLADPPAPPRDPRPTPTGTPLPPDPSVRADGRVPITSRRFAAVRARPNVGLPTPTGTPLPPESQRQSRWLRPVTSHRFAAVRARPNVGLLTPDGHPAPARIPAAEPMAEFPSPLPLRCGESATQRGSRPGMDILSSDRSSGRFMSPRSDDPQVSATLQAWIGSRLARV